MYRTIIFVNYGLQGKMHKIQSWKNIWTKQSIWSRTKKMFSMWSFHNMGWQALPMLRLHAQNKSQGNTCTTTNVNYKTSKTNLKIKLPKPSIPAYICSFLNQPWIFASIFIPNLVDESPVSPLTTEVFSYLNFNQQIIKNWI